MIFDTSQRFLQTSLSPVLEFAEPAPAPGRRLEQGGIS